MKLLVIGGTRGTGSHVVQQALLGGHAVTAFARGVANGANSQGPSRSISGDVTDTGALTEAMRGQDAVISTIGRGLSFKSEHLIERSVPSILKAMTAAGVRRLVFTSALGVGDTFADSPLVPKIFFSTLLRGIYADKLAGDNLIRNSSVDWTIVQPSQMNDGVLRKSYRSGEHIPLSGMPSISRADTAHFILEIVSDPSTFRKTLVVSY